MTQFNAAAYDIQRPTGQCAFTGRTLEPLETYIATLVENPETDDLTRLDVSLEAWEQDQHPDRLFSYWKTVVPEPSAKKKLFVDDAVLMNLILRLADAEQPQRIAFRFVLTLIMMRKKLLRYDSTEYRDAPPPPTPTPTPTPPPLSPSGATPTEGGAEAPAPAVDANTEPIAEEWWTLTPKLDLSKGPMGKWDESEKLHVLNPQLDEEGIGQVTDQLNEILQAEL